ncbi:MAG: glycosyltransferase family 4 protein [Candidatus Helarchaeota archaeon]|nr:glycosyltransferase family 4 protein [Candidatus Helarchaeota archaeon]
MAYALSKKGHEVHIILGVKNIPERLIKLCSPCCYLHQTLGYTNLIHIRKIMTKANRHILNLHKTCKFDSIEAHGITGVLIPSLLQDRLVVTLHGNNLKRGLNLFRFACTNSEMLTAIPRASKSFFEHIIGHFLYAKFEKKACQMAKLVVTLTPKEAYYAEKYYSILREKIRIVPNAIVNLKDNSSELVHIPEQKKAILSVGALEFIKGIPILTKAMRYVLASNQDMIYVSVGNGPLMSNVEELKAQFPKRVIILPHVSAGLSSIYARSRALVQGSLYEAFSLSIGEAMLAGKPVIAFRLASIPSLVIDNVTGFLAKPACSRDLAYKTLSLVRNEEETRSMGFNARKIVENRYNAEVVGSSMERVLKEV